MKSTATPILENTTGIPDTTSRSEEFVFAGLTLVANAVETSSILTTTPDAVTAAVHDRMPVILDLDSYDLWLDPGLRSVDFVSEPLNYSARMMRSYPVSSRINHVVNYDEEGSAPIELAQIQNQLFS